MNFRRLALGASLLVGVACGSSSSNDNTDAGPTNEGGSSSGSSGSSGTSGAVDSGSSGSSGSVDAGDAGQEAGGRPVSIGTVTVTQIKTDNGGTPAYATSANAVFYDGTATGGAGCTVTAGTPCSVTVCNLAQVGDAGAPSGGYPNAGTLHLSLPSGTTFDLDPTGANGTYPIPTGTAKIWNTGDTLTASATGGDVPAFANKMVIAPSDIVVTTPKFDAQNSTALSRKDDYPIGWSNGTAGDVKIVLQTTQVGVKSVTATCTYGANLGASPVPKAIMGQLDKADGTTIFGTMTVTPQHDLTFKAGAVDVTVRAAAGGKTGFFTAID